MTSGIARCLRRREGLQWLRAVGTAQGDGELSCKRAYGAETVQTTSSSLQTGDGSIQRTYRTVDVQSHPEKSGFHVLLDNRVLRTPQNAPLLIPTHALALAIGAEWEWQSERKVHPATMPLMTLAATAIDQPKPRVFMIEEMEEYIYSDPVLSRHKEPKLRSTQDLVPANFLHFSTDMVCQMFHPLQSWAEGFLNAKFQVSDAITGTQQSPATAERVRHFLSSFEPWKLISLHSMVLDCKSLLIGAALFHAQISVRAALTLSRVEEETQMEAWGLVEGGHDIDLSALYMKLMAASVFLKLLKV